MSYNFNLKTQVGKYTVEIDSAAKYGYFEHDIHGEGGGLWFNKGNSLEDFDGYSCIPKDVVKAIRELGFHVPHDMI